MSDQGAARFDVGVVEQLGDDPGPSARTGTGCIAQTDAPVAALEEQRARWVRFCPLTDEGAAQRLRHPQGVVVGDLAASVAVFDWLTLMEMAEMTISMLDPLAKPLPTSTAGQTMAIIGAGLSLLAAI